MKFPPTLTCLAIVLIMLGMAHAQQETANNESFGEAEVIADAVPPEVVQSATSAVAALGNEVVLGRYHAALERMNPLWKERVSQRMGSMQALEEQLAKIPEEMVRQGITMLSSKPEGTPIVHQVGPQKGKSGNLVYTKWLVLVPTMTKFRFIREGNPKPLVIESLGYQVAISPKDKLDWTFIDGAGLKVSDLRGLFITLPRNIELPPVSKREAR
ncbi:MAG: hypothetical protein KGQ87_11205 [Verrucomicrobia bacterium]|nr:hypothetical protein [Verrucomicrobiota bacterium]